MLSLWGLRDEDSNSRGVATKSSKVILQKTQPASKATCAHLHAKLGCRYDVYRYDSDVKHVILINSPNVYT